MKSKRIPKRSLSCVLSLVMMASNVPFVPFAAGAADPVTVAYKAYDATKKTFYDAEVTATPIPTSITSETAVWGSVNKTTWYTVNADVAVNMQAITIVGDVNLILEDGKTFTSTYGGINVLSGNSLTIYGQIEGTGKLTVTGSNSSGIGGTNDKDAGDITINGGTIDATGRTNAAGIGGGASVPNAHKSGSVTINGGIVKAKGDEGAAGIGGGLMSDGANVTINGAKQLLASGGEYSGNSVAAIGGGYSSSSSGTLSIGKGLRTMVANSSGTYDTVSTSSFTSNHSSDDVQICENRVYFYNYDENAAISYDTIYQTDNSAFSLQTSQPMSGTVTPSYYLQDAGEKVTLNFTPNTGNAVRIAKVRNLATGEELLNKEYPGNSCTFDMPNENVIVYVQFYKPKYTMNVASNITHGKIECSSTFADNAYYTRPMLMVAVPDEGYELYKWKVTDKNGNELDVGAYTADYSQYFDANQLEGAYTNSSGKILYYSFDVPASDVNISAEFKPLSYDIQTLHYDSTSGNVGIIEHGTIKAIYDNKVVDSAPCGETVSLEITPETGYRLKSGSLMLVTIDENDNVVTTPITNNQFTMPGGMAIISGEFEQINYNLSVPENITNGVVSINSINGAEYTDGMTAHAGDTIILAAEPHNLTGVSGIKLKDPATGDTIPLTEKANLSFSQFTEKGSIYQIELKCPDSNAEIIPEFSQTESYVVFYQNDTLNANTTVKVKYENQELTNGEGYEMLRTGNMWTFALKEAYEPEKLQFIIGDSTTTEKLDFSTNGQMLSAGSGLGQYQVVSGENAEENMIGVIIDKKDGSSSETAIMPATAPYAIPDPGTPQKENYEFLGWYTNSQGAEEAVSFPFTPQNTTYIYAKWKKSTCKLTIDDGVNAPSTTVVSVNQAVASPQIPEKPGYIFAGWYVAEDTYMDYEDAGGLHLTKDTPYNFNTIVTNNLSIKAKWKHIHSYKAKQIADVPGYENYTNLSDNVHVRYCEYDDSDDSCELVSHKYNAQGICECGYHSRYHDSSTIPKVKTIIGTNEPVETYVSQLETFELSAPSKNDSKFFSEWQYSYDNGNTWETLTSERQFSTQIVSSVAFRAVYSPNPIAIKINTELTHDLEYTMSFSLPEEYEYLDSGLYYGNNKNIGAYVVTQYTVNDDMVSIFELPFAMMNDLMNATVKKGLDKIHANRLFGLPDPQEPEPVEYTKVMEGNLLENPEELFSCGNKADDQAEMRKRIKEAMLEGKPVWSYCPEETVSVYSTKPKKVTEGQHLTSPVSFGVAIAVDFDLPLSYTSYYYTMGYVKYKDEYGIEHTDYTPITAKSYYEELKKEVGQ